jgi:hypothetical protein
MSHHGTYSRLGALFSGSQHFAVAVWPAVPSQASPTFKLLRRPCLHALAIHFNADFRTIPLGDICLQDEIRLETGTRTIGHLPDRGSVRRIYSARVGLEGNMTVAMYTGASAEEVRFRFPGICPYQSLQDWWEDITRCSRLR